VKERITMPFSRESATDNLGVITYAILFGIPEEISESLYITKFLDNELFPLIPDLLIYMREFDYIFAQQR
jgi:hypothetical protein